MSAWEAGPELDALIAERVMGLHRHVSGRGEPYWCFTREPLAECSRHYGSLFPEPYSTDIAAAWQVVARLAERWAHVGVTCEERDAWYCYVYHDSVSPFIREFARGSAPLAICRAALQAVEAE